jgi:HSP20 family protein
VAAGQDALASGSGLLPGWKGGGAMFSLLPWRKERSPARALARLEHPLERFREDVNALFEDFFGRFPSLFEPSWSWPMSWGVDLEDTDQEIILRADAPGFEASDFDIQVSGNVLTIRAEHKQESKGGDGRTYERRLHRTLTLPAGVDPNGVEARYRNGVLELHLPKTPEARARRIEVKT